MQRRRPYVGMAGVGVAMAAVLGGSEANGQESVTMSVNVGVANLVTVQTSVALNFQNLSILPGGTAEVVWGANPTSTAGVASVTGNGLAVTANATAGVINFTRNGTVTITPGSAQVTLACFRGAAGSTPATGTLAVTVGGVTGVGISYAANTAFGTGACTSPEAVACSLFVLPRIQFPSQVGSGACSSGTLSIPLVYS